LIREGLAVALGGLVALDRKSFLQAALARPLAASTLVGVCLGETRASVGVGVVLELLYLGTAHLGASLTDHETLAALTLASAVAAGAAGHPERALGVAAMALLLAFPVGRAGRALDGVENERRQRYADRSVALAEAGEVEQALRLSVGPLWFPLATGAGAVAVGLGLGFGLAHLPAQAFVGWERAWAAMAVSGAAAAVMGSRAERAAWIGASAAALAATLCWALG
jgi:PTS system mannose-specific IIC component